ncbi:MAG TPA: L-histidine N(alpha)-methyltransferase [Terriglobia bacterium]|nr:L-histidine N(alpha)-methyltransferase [Terriglobia bacterium]
MPVSAPALIAEPVARFAEEVRAGLSTTGQKELPSKYLYDEVGSALFEVISVIPEYGLTRADARLLQRCAGEIAARLPGRVVVAELGSGSGKKTRWILEALTRYEPTTYHPIEISAAALAMCARELGDLKSVSIVGLEEEYLDGLAKVASRRAQGERLLVLFLGSSIGNFDREPGGRFLRNVRQELLPGDALLLGADLVKPIPQMILAYDDPAGVTAAFNLNLLARINRELDGDFVLSRFHHLACYNSQERRIEMHLRSTAGQTVSIRRAGFSVQLQEGETIWTESSHKYSAEEMFGMAERTGFRCDAQWIDEEWPFAQNLFVAAL